MKDFVIFSLGCKVNQVEGQSLAETLARKGYSFSFDLEPAAHYIINTCSVTGEAHRKSRQAVARALKHNREACVYILGCASQNDIKSFVGKPNVRYVGGTAGKAGALQNILKLAEEGTAMFGTTVSIVPVSTVFEPLDKPFQCRTRAYIKVQDGCNQFCSYCIVPILRGRSRSRNLNDILIEARRMAAESKEIVLTGINLSDYRQDGQSALPKLVAAFSAIDVRKRLGSLDICAVTEELLFMMQNAGFCNHFHLSAQSGSNGVLSRMNRRYTAFDVLKKVDLIRKLFPNAGITSDIIVGFPGETDVEFSETVKTVQKAAFSDMHIFPYSERIGTKAAELMQVPIGIRGARAAELAQIGEAIRARFLKSQIGKTAEVYTESSGDGTHNAGFATNYVKVYSQAPVHEISRLVLSARYKDGLLGI
ncbi:MAG: MiaB/RimO family radical SAM methylthiotransferase [Firmicutes bacterium]|nr:MiaB/RimO family radical SAM methylthiotransferase [Bacillota bacterium]